MDNRNPDYDAGIVVGIFFILIFAGYLLLAQHVRLFYG